MIFLEIVMILIGLGAVAMSLAMSDPRSLKGTVQGTGVNVDYEKLTKEHLESYQDIIQDMAEDVQNEAEDRMDKISNEKIMAISEYSDQVLDRIEKNHAEVVFLYNMLNEKQDEIKELVAETDKTKAELRDELAGLYQENMELIRESKEEFMNHMEQKLQTGLGNHETVPEEKEAVDKKQPRKAAPDNTPDSNSGVFQHKEEILDLHQKGHSILDISRLLAIGQGEVRFVIDLYGN